MAIDYKKIVLKNSATPGAIPIPDFLSSGELALNYADNKIYYKTLDGSIVVHETPDIDVDPSPNSIVRRNLDGSGIFNGVISESTDADIYSIYATHSTCTAAKIINTGLCAGAEISSDLGTGAEISSISGTGAIISSNTSGTGAIISSISGTGAEISSNTSGTGAIISSTSGTGAIISSVSGISLSASSETETGAIISSTSGTGAEITSFSGTAAEIYTEDGDYHATFGDPSVNVLGISNNDNGSVDIDWLTVSNEIITSTSKLKSGATANQTWTLPNETGTLATKEYVNILAQGLHIHASVHVILKTSLESLGAGTVTYTNGTAGVGAKLTLQNPLTQAMLDGDPDALTVGARIIVAGQSNQAINGIYTYSTSTELIRATDFDEPAEVAGGDFVFVTHGTIGANTGWVLSEKVTSISSTGSPFIFQQFSGVGTFTAGNGLTLVGGTDFNVNSTTLTVGADAVDLASGIATAGTYQSVTVDTYGRVTAGTNPTTVTYTAGNGLTLADGTDFNVNSTGAGSLTVGADTINLTSGIATAGTYKSVTVDTYGRVTAGTNPTTLAGYGITDAVNAVATIVPISAATEFISTDNAKIFHVSGTTTLTLPSAGSILDGWSIGIVNVGGAPLTVNRSSTDTINGALTTFSNTVPYSAFYIYKSSSSTFVAIGILY